MILYSIMPPEIVFADYGYTYRKDENACVELEYLGERVQASALSNSEYVITRIISTSPRAYLNPKLQPGRIIKRDFFVNNRYSEKRKV